MPSPSEFITFFDESILLGSGEEAYPYAVGGGNSLVHPSPATPWRCGVRDSIACANGGRLFGLLGFEASVRFAGYLYKMFF